MVETNWHLETPSGEQLSAEELQAISRIRASYASLPGFKHPLWEFLKTGDYDAAVLKHFALLYYPHVREFRRYLAGAITVASVESLQAELAEILAEEYGRRFDPDLMAYTPAHPELYRDFMRSLGVTEDEWTRIPMSPGLDAMKGEIFELVQNRMEEHVLGAIIFGMEATTPYRHQCVTMGIERVMEREGIVVDHRFFSRHIDVDPRHGQSLLMPIRSWLADDARVFGLIDGAARAFSARAIFLDEVFTTLTKR